MSYLSSRNPSTGYGIVTVAAAPPPAQSTLLERRNPASLDLQGTAPFRVDFDGRLTSGGNPLIGKTIHLMVVPLDAAGQPTGPEVDSAQGVTDTNGMYALNYSFAAGKWGWVLRYLGD